VRMLPKAAVLLAIAASSPGTARAAAGTRLTHVRTLYADAADVPLRSPEGVACNAQGALVVADTGNARLLTYTWKDGALEGGAQVMLAQLAYPVRVQIDGKGFVLALDRRAKRIVKVGADGSYAGVVQAKGASVPMTVAAFRLGPADALYVLDVAAARVLVLEPEGKVVRELPLPPGAPGITDVAVDARGRILVVDAVTATVFFADPEDAAFKPLSSGLKEQVSFPTYLTPDDHGRLYLVDQNGHAIVTLGIDGTFQARDLSLGSTEGAVQYPAQLCLLPDGDAVVADRDNNRVQIFATPR